MPNDIKLHILYIETTDNRVRWQESWSWALIQIKRKPSAEIENERERERERVSDSCNVQISNIKSNQAKHKIYKKIDLIMIFRSEFVCSIYLRLQTRAKMKNPHIFFRSLCLHIMYALNVALYLWRTFYPILFNKNSHTKNPTEQKIRTHTYSILVWLKQIERSKWTCRWNGRINERTPMQHSPEKKYTRFSVHLCYRYCCIGNPHQKLWLLKTFYLTFNLVIKLIVADYVGARKTQIGLHPMYKFGVFFCFCMCFFFGFMFVCGCSSAALHVVRKLWWINFLSLWKCLFCIFPCRHYSHIIWCTTDLYTILSLCNDSKYFKTKFLLK